MSRLDDLKTELNRASGMNKGSQTQLGKAQAILAEIMAGSVPTPVPVPVPQPGDGSDTAPVPGGGGLPLISRNPLSGTTIDVDQWGHSGSFEIVDIAGVRAARVTYRQGHNDGDGSGRMWRDFPTRPRVIEFEYEEMRSPNWEPHPVLDKAGYVHGTGQPGGGNPVFWGTDKEGRVWVYKQHHLDTHPTLGNRNLEPNRADVRLGTGRWDKVRIQLVADRDSSPGSGEARVWVNGSLTLEHTGLHWGNTTWDALNVDPIWGGNMTPDIFVKQTMYRYYRNAVISGR